MELKQRVRGLKTNSHLALAGSISPHSVQFGDGSTAELVTVPAPRLLNNLNLAAYSTNGNGNGATVSVNNGWPPGVAFFDNASNYSTVMGQTAAGAGQGIQIDNLRVATANQLGAYGK